MEEGPVEDRVESEVRVESDLVAPLVEAPPIEPEDELVTAGPDVEALAEELGEEPWAEPVDVEVWVALNVDPLEVDPVELELAVALDVDPLEVEPGVELDVAPIPDVVAELDELARGGTSSRKKHPEATNPANAVGRTHLIVAEALVLVFEQR